MKWYLALSIIFLVSCSSERPGHLGLKTDGEDQSLHPCPDKPNCVSSFSEESSDAYTKPIKVEGEITSAHDNLVKIISSMDGAKIVTNEPNYLHAEYTSGLFKFVDDLELYFPSEGPIHIKSASRLGHSDLGVNSKRVEKIKFRFYQNEI